MIYLDQILPEDGAGSGIRIRFQYGVAIYGHVGEKIRQGVLHAVQEAAAQGLGYGAPTEIETRMAEMLCRWVPSMDLVRMVNSGTEATMSAIRLARGFTGRDVVVKFVGCYHGHVDSLLVEAGSGLATFGTPSSGGVPAGFTESTAVLPLDDDAALENFFSEHGDKVAALIEQREVFERLTAG